jgi:hypothetical protein
LNDFAYLFPRSVRQCNMPQFERNVQIQRFSRATSTYDDIRVRRNTARWFFLKRPRSACTNLALVFEATQSEIVD